jgi:hypothetical protein
MNELKNYVDYVQPIIKAIHDNHNQFHLLQYFTVNAEDLTVSNGLLEFMTEAKNRPEHFNVEVGINNAIPLVYAQYGEETGASLVLELTAEQRNLLSPEVANTILGEHYKLWEDGVVYLLMNHEYYTDVAGFKVWQQFDPTSGGVEEAIKFLSSAMGIGFYTVDNPYAGLDYHLDMMNQTDE